MAGLADPGSTSRSFRDYFISLLSAKHYMDDVELNKRRKRLGNAVRVERVEQRLSQERLGRMVGTNQTYISLLEAGEINVTFNKLCRIAEALEVEVSDLVR